MMLLRKRAQRQRELMPWKGSPYVGTIDKRMSGLSLGALLSLGAGRRTF